jgi:hypothetical protein
MKSFKISHLMHVANPIRGYQTVLEIEPHSDQEIERAYRKSTLKLRDLNQHTRIEVYVNFETLN